MSAALVRYSPTELDKILRVGLSRMDQAVERVTEKYSAPQLPQRECVYLSFGSESPICVEWCPTGTNVLNGCFGSR